MITIITEFLAEQKRLAEAATPGPWRLGSFGHGPNAIVRDAEGLATVQDVWVCDADAGAPENAAFIAAARTSVPRMIAALEAVMGVFPGADDPCPPRTCTHVDCEVINAIRVELGGEGE